MKKSRVFGYLWFKRVRVKLVEKLARWPAIVGAETIILGLWKIEERKSGPDF